MSELISVIVCCYNPDIVKLKNTIKSVVNQKDVSTEIIVADDGSRNEYKEELLKWANDNEIELVPSFLEKNEGTVINILKALEKCKGRYVKDISPGDYLHDEYTLKTLYESIIKSESDMVFGDATYYADDKIVFDKQYPNSNTLFDEKRFAKYYCLNSNYFLGAAFFIKKDIYYSCLSKIRGYSRLSEDFSTVCISIMEGYKIGGIKHPVIWYECGSGISTGNSPNKQLYKDVDSIYEYIYQNYSTNRLAVRMYKRYKLKSASFIKKLFGNIVFYPDCLFRILIDKFYKPVNYDSSLEGMYRIIG